MSLNGREWIVKIHEKRKKMMDFFHILLTLDSTTVSLPGFC